MCLYELNDINTQPFSVKMSKKLILSKENFYIKDLL